MKATVNASLSLDTYQVSIWFEGHVAASFPKYVGLKETTCSSATGTRPITIFSATFGPRKGNDKNEAGAKRLLKLLSIAGRDGLVHSTAGLNGVTIDEILTAIK